MTSWLIAVYIHTCTRVCVMVWVREWRCGVLKANSHCHARYDTHRTVSSCLVWWCELSRLDRQTGAFCVWSVSEWVWWRSATAGRTPMQNTLVRWSIHTTTPDKTRLPHLPVDCLCRGWASHAATPSHPTAHMQWHCMPQKCKHAVDCCIWLNLNFSTKHHATRVIYWLTVKSLPDCLQT